jgi:DNA invertase Pin-like site-specific DNA recombinase
MKAPAKPARQAAGAILGYGRVSREGQDLAQQRAALRAAGCARLFEEKASGGRWDRPELHRLLDHLRPGDVVVVWKLDRLSRSLKDLLHIMETIGEAGAGFRSLTEHIDTTTPAGRMMMQMVGAFAEFERAMIRERTSAGLAAARAEGRIGGRRKKLDDTKRRERGGHLRSEDRSTDGADVRRVGAHRVAYRCRSRGRGCASGPQATPADAGAAMLRRKVRRLLQRPEPGQRR